MINVTMIQFFKIGIKNFQRF